MGLDKKLEINTENLNALIECNIAYIIKTVSSVTQKYVSVEHDDEFAVALNAFAEAVERYDGEKGNFLSYAGLVMRSRLLTYLKKEQNSKNSVSLDELIDKGYEPHDSSISDPDLHEEIMIYINELKKFNLSLESMADYSPVHKSTRKTSVSIAEKSSHDEKIVSDTYRRKKLPIRPVARLCNVTEKIVKTSKNFILGTMLVFVLKLSCLIFWINETR